MTSAKAEPEIEVVFAEDCPYGGLSALLQSDGRTLYFYLYGEGAFGTRACWVGNLQTGPWTFAEEDLASGRAPCLPRIHVTADADRWSYQRSAFEVIWFPEGNGAFLLADRDVLAVIPPWSGGDGFHGFSRFCASENLVCSPLPDKNQWAAELMRAEAFWSDWTQRGRFSREQPRLLSAYGGALGEQTEYFSIDGDRFPPRGAVCFRGAQHRLAVTVGMSLCPQPIPRDRFWVDADGAAGDRGRWIELGIALATDHDGPQTRQQVQLLAGVARLPWTQWKWLAVGHEIEISDGSQSHRFRVTGDNPIAPANEVLLPTLDGHRAELLWLVSVRSN